MNKKILSIIAAALLVFSFTVSCKKQPAAETAAKAEGANAEETKAEEEKEYTFNVAGQVNIDGKWVLKRERITVTAKSQISAENKARDEFSRMYTGYGLGTAVNKDLLKRPSVSLVSTCDNYNYNF